MKFIKLGSKYALKNSWWLMLLWILPSVFVGLLCSPFHLIEFMNCYPNTEISNFGDLFKILLPFSWQTVVFGALGILLISIFLSMVIGQAESHMRSGKLNFKEIFSHINNNILVVLINIILIELLSLVLTFLFGSIIFVFHLLLSGLSKTPTVLCVIIAIVLCSANLILLVFLTMSLLINIPNMISNGYSLKEGISSTFGLMTKNAFGLLIAYILPYVVIIPLVSLLYTSSVWWLVNILGFLILTVYYSSITMTAYFELSDTNRYDNRKYYNYR